MKKIYFLVVVLISISWLGNAQTYPTAQSLPFNFTALSGSTLPTGTAMHKFGITAATIPTIRTLAAGTSDLAYNSASTSGGWKEESANGISLLASGSNAAGAFITAINTTGLTNVQIQWTIKLLFLYLALWPSK